MCSIDWYTYENTYIDDNDAEQSMYSENDVTLIAPSTSFATHFAAVADLEVGP